MLFCLLSTTGRENAKNLQSVIQAKNNYITQITNRFIGERRIL